MSEAQSYNQGQCEYEAVIPEKTAQTTADWHCILLLQYFACELMPIAISINQFALIGIIPQ
jgi:hypothetical protein